MPKRSRGGALRKTARPVIEDEIERLISYLDLLDGDCDLEEGYDRERCCEDEGSQCDDEGWREADEAPPPPMTDWRHEANMRDLTTAACSKAVEGLRTIQRRMGRQPVDPLRGIAGAIPH